MSQKTPTTLPIEIIDPDAINSIYEKMFNFFNALGLDNYYTHMITAIALLIAVSLVLYITDYVIRNILLKLVKTYILKSKTNIDDILVHNKVFDYFTHIIPLILAKILFPIIFLGFPNLTSFTLKTADIFLVVAIILFIRSLVKSARDFARTLKSMEDKPLDSYFQVVSIFLYFVAGIIIFSMLTGKSPWAFLVSLGAASAILMLVFKDTIMGFVASIQVSSNDMVRVGDWIEMSKFGADGTVTQINLNTVKVQNFDKTITTIPTHLLISDSFKNYRGMQVSGGRRIKRSINVKISSIRFLEPEEIEELKKIQILAPYIEQRTAEIEQYNKETNADPSMPVNGRKITNVGLFRAYITRYAERNPGIHKDMTLMVRQLHPTEHGLPIELYMFTNDIVWTNYEMIMSDMFDHLLASIKFFKLEVFELPASDDLRSLKS
ncbi:mechanosensitive ion channel family protein [Flavobacterium sp. NKUCC04_CG]|uniref:mechanosensitive ion channel family protein n=1 Tax=Flavobacterium sp. NKUCC04_CG TaxID=2842121 RepID=UPI001C5B9582|nr:mechanosensitive ion channel domain-containing protein [Flavobacterium sp. NKUCC04_CG]MBW3519917.1 mechanosensitive ion channel family protein [Flavobacterium sp. NKUCC04_CG]